MKTEQVVTLSEAQRRGLHVVGMPEVTKVMGGHEVVMVRVIDTEESQRRRLRRADRDIRAVMFDLQGLNRRMQKVRGPDLELVAGISGAIVDLNTTLNAIRGSSHQETP